MDPASYLICLVIVGCFFCTGWKLLDRAERIKYHQDDNQRTIELAKLHVYECKTHRFYHSPDDLDRLGVSIEALAGVKEGPKESS